MLYAKADVLWFELEDASLRVPVSALTDEKAHELVESYEFAWEEGCTVPDHQAGRPEWGGRPGGRSGRQAVQH